MWIRSVRPLQWRFHRREPDVDLNRQPRNRFVGADRKPRPGAHRGQPYRNAGLEASIAAWSGMSLGTSPANYNGYLRNGPGPTGLAANTGGKKLSLPVTACRRHGHAPVTVHERRDRAPALARGRYDRDSLQ